jgi:hypothetical protein
VLSSLIKQISGCAACDRPGFYGIWTRRTRGLAGRRHGP